MFKNKFKILLLSVLVISVIFTGCSDGLFGGDNGDNGDSIDDELALIEKNIENHQEIDEAYSLEFDFTDEISDVELVLKKNGEQVEEVSKDLAGSKLTITDFSYQQASVYNLALTAKNDSGAVANEVVSFLSQREEYPTVDTKNDTMMQTFYWEIGEEPYLSDHPDESDLWQLLKGKAEEISELGITSLWLPPASKGWKGVSGVGYGVYDLWDLGEFNQKETTRTRFGTREELESALTKIDESGMEAYFDVAFNHRMGAERTETVKLSDDSPDLAGEEIEAWTYFEFDGREEYYSRADEFDWNWEVFDAVDYDDRRGINGTFLFEGKEWDNTYRNDYLMGSDVDFQHKDVIHEMNEWGRWIINDIGFDGFRLDAIKHVDSDFTDQWLDNVQQSTDEDIFFVAEAWEDHLEGLTGYLEAVGVKELNAFDFPLRGAFAQMRDGNFDMRYFAEAGLVNETGYENRAVTFVDNHDTHRDGDDYGRAIDNRKYQAYSYILMREEGLPKLYWRDYYIDGLEKGLTRLLKARKYFAYGEGIELNINDSNTYGYLRTGNNDGTGLVMLISQSEAGGVKEVTVNNAQPNTTYYDYTGNLSRRITTDETGNANFAVEQNAQRGWSIWVPLDSR